ncbi:hypothetical protein LTR22_008313 [Elasticomyces elasticus]|nr:hypothetical protein LTR22_008313 [Elasticomyces elasticus]KAK4921285.1 hypothetical protein LTR49_011288 [Elasticomyces elasticus]KAK5759703.1 hypothetical protein LTS12_010220 [Elasticomyces elasticus]
MADTNDPFGCLQSALRGDPSPSTTHQHRTGVTESQPQPTANASNDARLTRKYGCGHTWAVDEGINGRVQYHSANDGADEPLLIPLDDTSLCHNCNLEEDWLIKHDHFGGAKESDVSLLSLEQKHYCREKQMRPRDFIVVQMLLLGRMLELVKQLDLPVWWRTSMVQHIWAQLKELQQSGRLYKTLNIGKCAAAMTFLCEMWYRKIGRFGSDVTAGGMEKIVKTFRALLDRRLREHGQVSLSDS